MANQTALFHALRSFATRSVQDYDLHDALDTVGRQALDVLEVDGAGVTLRVAAGPRPTQYVTATDSRTLRVEREQDALSEGPCIDAITAGRPVPVEDIQALDTWPAYSRALVAADFRAVAGIPMFGGSMVVGALNCYAEKPRQWSQEDLEAGQLLANISSSYIANAASYADQVVVASQLQHALDSRILIEQAKGVIAERYGLGMDKAFAALRAYARSQSAKIHDVAADVLAGRQDIDI